MDVPIEEVLDAPCGPKTRHRGRIGRWAGLTEPQFFGMAGPASSLRPSSSSPTSARRSRSVRDAEEDTEFSRHKSRRPSRTPRRSLRPFRGEIRLSANGRSTGGWQDRISAAVGGTCRCEERRGSSAHPRGAVRDRRVKGQRKGRVCTRTRTSCTPTRTSWIAWIVCCRPRARHARGSAACQARQGARGGRCDRFQAEPLAASAISWRSSLRTVGRRAVASCQPDGAPALRTCGRH